MTMMSCSLKYLKIIIIISQKKVWFPQVTFLFPEEKIGKHSTLNSNL